MEISGTIHRRAGGLSALHLFAANVLMPAIVGRRVHLNALAVTVALLFWGWLWGGMDCFSRFQLQPW